MYEVFEKLFSLGSQASKVPSCSILFGLIGLVGIIAAITPAFTAPEEGAPTAGGQDFGIKAYDNFWVAPGDRLAVVKGEYRSSYIVDPPNGQIPFVDAAAIEAKRRRGSVRYATGIGGNEGPEATNLAERCLIGFGNTGGPGMLSTLYNNTHQIVQTGDHVMILVEMVHDARIIPTFDTAKEARENHRPSAIRPWLGDSVGWYEGATLVVETMNIRPEQRTCGATSRQMMVHAQTAVQC